LRIILHLWQLGTDTNLRRVSSQQQRTPAPLRTSHEDVWRRYFPPHADAIYIVDSSGGTPTLDTGNLISSFNKNYHFLRLNQYQISQWVDVQSQRFVNYFSVAATSTKYELVGSLSVSTGNYQVVMQNNFPTQGKFSKEVVITEVGILGVTNHLMGFTMFAYGKRSSI
jgi:hypothetical protein